MPEQMMEAGSLAQLQAVLKPQSIAIIGASIDPNKIGGRPVEYLKRYGYQGEIYPINPKATQVQGLTSYAQLADVPGSIDLVIIAVPRQHVLSLLHDCGQKQVKAVIIFSSGFAELGEAGRKEQETIAQIAHQYGMRIIGPNCQGVANLQAGSMATFSTSFAAGEEQPELGPTAIISQSGAVAAMLYNIQKKYGRGIKYWLASGNEADVHVSELMQVILDDPEVKVLQVYLEDIKDGQAFIQAAEQARAMRKPILALKSGRTAAGSKAASSHTGALASDDLVLDTVFAHYGVVRVDNILELGLFPQVFEMDKQLQGKKVAIITNSGGLGVMMIDTCQALGLDLAVFEEETKKELAQVLPDFASVANPVDVATQLLNDHDLLAKILPILMRDPNVDIILIGLGILGQGYDIPKMITHVAKAQVAGYPLIALTGVGCQHGIIEEFSKQGVPAFDDPTLCIKAVAQYAQYQLEFLEGRSGVSALEQIEPSTGRVEKSGGSAGKSGVNVSLSLPTRAGFIDEYESKQVLQGWGLPTTREVLCTSVEEACLAAERIGYPVVLKICSAHLLHKTEIGGVQLNIQDEAELRTAFTNMLAIAEREVGAKLVDGILVQEMVIGSRVELSLGLKRDPLFGPLVMVASGGIYIEVLKDFQLLVAPVDEARARQAVDALHMAPLLYGVRGKPAHDLEALCQTIVSFSQIVAQVDQLAEVDLNPVLVLEEGKGVKIVDALVKLNHG